MVYGVLSIFEGREERVWEKGDIEYDLLVYRENKS